MKNNFEIYFIYTGLGALILGMLLGCLGALQFIIPGFLLNTLPFHKVRPLHVSLMVSWIFLAAIGGVYYYLPQICQRELYSKKLVKIHYAIFIITGIAILVSYLQGVFGGREYWEFPPIFAIPILLSWVLFGINFFATISPRKERWPVYLWMWATGILFFFFSYVESYLWVIPYFRDTIGRDLTVQWKSYGALIGAWNMLIYGTAFYLMEKIDGNKELALSPLVFFFYFLGLVNLMFNWGHHIYIVPTAWWIKNVAFIISMTELLILFKVIWDWKQNLPQVKKKFHYLPYRFIVASDFWILTNLILALLISIPAINIYTHGTHVTVAHAMGSTIGINTMLLMASAYYIFSRQFSPQLEKSPRMVSTGFWMANISLLILWITLIAAGIARGYYTFHHGTGNFYELTSIIKPYIMVFAVAGFGIFLGMFLCIFPLLKSPFGKREPAPE